MSKFETLATIGKDITLELLLRKGIISKMQYWDLSENIRISDDFDGYLYGSYDFIHSTDYSTCGIPPEIK